MTANGYGFFGQEGGDKNILELDSRDNCPTTEYRWLCGKESTCQYRSLKRL